MVALEVAQAGMAAQDLGDDIEELLLALLDLLFRLVYGSVSNGARGPGAEKVPCG